MKNLISIITSFLMISVILNIGLISKIVYDQRISSNAHSNDYFNKKKDCAKLATQIKTQVEQDNAAPFAIGSILVESIFYSPKEDSCLYSTERLIDGKREYFIFNALTNSKVTSFQFPSQFDDYKKFLFEYSDGEIRI